MSISKRQIEERKLRKDRILSGALDVFKKKGIDNATMEEIGKKSGFGTATLYYYFHSKEDVFSAILLNGWEQLWESLEPVIAKENTPRKKFIKILLKTSETIRSKPNLYEFLFNAPKKITFDKEPWKKYQERLYATLHSLLKESVDKGEFPNVNPTLLFKALGGLFMGIVLMGDKNEPVSEDEIEKLLNQIITNPLN